MRENTLRIYDMYKVKNLQNVALCFAAHVGGVNTYVRHLQHVGGDVDGALLAQCAVGVAQVPVAVMTRKCRDKKKTVGRQGEIRK